MLKSFFSLLMVLLLSTNLTATDTTKDKYHMFPKAKDGYVRYIVAVPKTENDQEHKVELLIGKNLMVDCNHASLSGKIERKTLKGWGYHYLEVSDIKRGPTTMMACPQPKIEKFIPLYAPQETLIRYNSRLGTVIYVPKDIEVRYRIWSASEELKTASQH
jgi:ecotin